MPESISHLSIAPDGSIPCTAGELIEQGLPEDIRANLIDINDLSPDEELDADQHTVATTSDGARLTFYAGKNGGSFSLGGGTLQVTHGFNAYGQHIPL